MRRALWLLLALFARGVSGSDSLTPISPMLRIPDVQPRQIPSSVPENVRVIVRSGAEWRLRATWKPEPNTAIAAGEEIEILASSGQWMPLRPELPVEVGGGPATSAAGMTLTLPLRGRATFDSPPGARRGVLRVALNAGATADLDLTYEVAPAATFVEVLRHAVGTVHPWAPDHYAFEERTFRVVSNAPWTLEALLRSPARQKGQSFSLPDGSVTIASRGEPERRRQLVRNQAVTAAAGSATGEQGTSAEVVFSVEVTGNEVGGSYIADIEFQAVPGPVSRP